MLTKRLYFKLLIGLKKMNQKNKFLGVNENNEMIFAYESFDENDYYTKIQVDDLITREISTINIYNDVIDGNQTKIIDLSNDKVMVMGQIVLSSEDKEQWKDLYNSLPPEIKNLRNVNNIEYFDYVFLEAKSGQTNKQKVFTSSLANVACSSYNNRIYISNEVAIPSYISFIRFKIVYDKLK